MKFNLIGSAAHWNISSGNAAHYIKRFDIPVLEHRRAKHRITMFYKIINNLVNIPVHHQLNVHDSSTRGTATQI